MALINLAKQIIDFVDREYYCSICDDNYAEIMHIHKTLLNVNFYCEKCFKKISYNHEDICMNKKGERIQNHYHSIQFSLQTN